MPRLLLVLAFLVLLTIAGLYVYYTPVEQRHK